MEYLMEFQSMLLGAGGMVTILCFVSTGIVVVSRLMYGPPTN